MKFKSILPIAGLLALLPMAAQAVPSDSATLNATAEVTSSASLTLTQTGGGAATGLTFAGVGGANATPSEGVITVNAQVTTGSENNATVISVSSTDLTGSLGNTIPAGALSWTHGADSGGGAWNDGTMTTNSTPFASLPVSGTYSGDQNYTLAIPANASADNYTGTVSYVITGF